MFTQQNKPHTHDTTDPENENNKSLMKFQTTTITTVLLVIFLIILVAAGINYHVAEHVVEKTVISHQEDLTGKAVSTVELWLNQQMKILSATADSIPPDDFNEEKATMQLLHMAMKAGHFSDVYIGTEQGKLIDGAMWIPPAGYDPRDRPWYRRAEDAQTISFTTPYIDLVTNDLVIALVKPLIYQNKFLGVMGADTVLDSLVENVLNFKQSESGYAFVIERNGTIIIHPNREYVMREHLPDIEPDLEYTIQRLEQVPSGTVSYLSASGVDSLLSFKPIANSDWILCLTIPRSEAYSITRETTMIFAMKIVLRILGIIAFIALLGLGGGSLFLYIYDRRYSTAVQEHEEQLSHINKDLEWNISKRMEVETYYKKVFDVANDAILISHDLHYVECNHKAEEIFATTKENLLSKTILDFCPRLQPDGSRSTERLRQILLQAKESRQNVFRWSFIRGDGKEFPASVSLTTFELNGRELVLSSIRDISKRVRAEGQLMQAQKMAAAGEMLGAIAHQWRQPLNTLSTYISSLQSAYYNAMLSADFVEKVIAGANDQITFMSKTIDDFRNFFKPSKTKGPVDILKAVINAVKLLEAQMRQSEILLTIHNKTGANSLLVFGYQGEFVHVLVNILGNAKDAIMDRVEKEDPKAAKNIEILVSSDEDWAIIEIIDSGSGIPDELMERIFTPYFTTKGTSSGMGMGLYMSKMIVEKEMGGMLTAKNTTKGTSFTLKLKKMSLNEHQ
ncbi:cache domain-containing protein [Desulfogranum japonicum]|uniref:cache domain-containing protein n=1 Tax=Desulfogranum japonicum TaxID=231447 RepID=UPI000412C56E|nr:cache domain-containing protein [Desulfogranum japonicum]